ncbi:MAG: carbohydrate binding family 9 domain-containing protein [Chitinophagales bacterium]|nr:carbohydrate binding family 9 domain-containing protein [Chitinophagales bacterium]
MRNVLSLHCLQKTFIQTINILQSCKPANAGASRNTHSKQSAQALKFLYFVLFCLLPVGLSAQITRAAHQEKYRIEVAHTETTFKIDGALDESEWQKAQPASNFSMKWPRDGGPAPEQTEVRCLFNDKFLYIGITAWDSSPNYVIQSLKRDVGYWDSDGVAVLLDPANAAVSGYFFGVSPKGVQTEALVAAGNDDMDTNWDNTWWVETKTYADRWTAEYAIPLRILRFKEGQQTWGINIIRNDLSNGIYSTWAMVPFQFDGIDLGWCGALHWAETPKRVKGNYNLVPYLSGGIQRDYEAGDAAKAVGGAGLDAKIGIGSGLNLDVTVNPDFSQIEIDEQVVNLTRFDVQLPEKRTFFLESADIFANFGIPPIRPFFSRRIGLNDNGLPLPIIGGLRLTGNLDGRTRIGALTMQTAAKSGTPSQNYSALSMRRTIKGRSTVAGYFLNRENFQDGEWSKSQYSRNAGYEGNVVSANGRWEGWFAQHFSFRDDSKKRNFWMNGGFNYATRKFNFLLDMAHMGDNYRADLGFETRIQNYDVLRDTVLRIGYNFIYSQSNYRFFSSENKSSRLNFIELGMELFQVFNPDATLNESSNNISAEFNYKNTSSIRVYFNPNWANVPVAFKFDDEADLEKCPPLPAQAYSFQNGGIEWGSDYRKRFVLNLEGTVGGFYNGKQYSGSATISWRYRTLGTLRLSAQYNLLDFPEPYCDVVLFNLTPRVEVFFSKKLWWTTFVQYNTQADNFNINSRLQWRFRPMSDLFVVYTDNYSASAGNVKSRGLVAKANYWF